MPECQQNPPQTLLRRQTEHPVWSLGRQPTDRSTGSRFSDRGLEGIPEGKCGRHSSRQRGFISQLNAQNTTPESRHRSQK